MNTLKIYRAPSGQWSGVILVGDEEIGRVAGCESPEEVEQAVNDAGQFFDQIELIEDVRH